MYLVKTNAKGGRPKRFNSMKNTHLQHPEDSILTGDLSVLDWFLTDGEVSTKIDGAPAIVSVSYTHLRAHET